MTNYSQLRPEKVIETLEKLHQRIKERFPNRGLVNVCSELTELAKVTSERSRRIARPNIFLRTIVALVVAGAIGLLIYIFYYYPTYIQVDLDDGTVKADKGLQLITGIEALANIVLLLGAAIFSLWTWEKRYKQRRSLEFLNELNAITHVIDMHQLTKDPSFIIISGPKTSSSPKREMSEFELTRYLDYCSEMLSLTAKLAAFYAQSMHEPAVVRAAADIEQLTTNMSRKIWQKIILVQNNTNAIKHSLSA